MNAVAVASPTQVLSCPRCGTTRILTTVDGTVTHFCGGCEWTFTLGTTSPTGTLSGSHNAGMNHLTLASGGASFTNGMFMLIDSGTTLETNWVNGTATGTNVPLAVPLSKQHGNGTTFAQLAVMPKFSGVQAVPARGNWGF
jgi:hypothetical protein